MEDYKKIQGPVDRDILFKNLSRYTENDPDFILIFIENVIKNLHEIEDQIPKLREKKDILGLRELIHKVSPTAEIIGQKDLLWMLRIVQKNWERGVFYANQNALLAKTDKIIVSLREIVDALSRQNEDELKEKIWAA